jgi:aminopeptidase N
MGKLFGMLGALVAYVSIGTVLALGMGVGYLMLNGALTRERTAEIVAILQGFDRRAAQAAADADRDAAHASQASPADLARARALKNRDLELREQALRNYHEQVRSERVKLTQETDRYKQIKTAFDTELNTLRETAVATSQENARVILENIKPKQAKEQIVRMVQAGEMKSAVMLLSAMPVTKRAKVITEFKTDEESQLLAEMLKLIRQGEPEVTLIDRTRDQLDAAPQSQP